MARTDRPIKIHQVPLRPGDVVFTRGSNIFSRAIRWATREEGEAPTLVNHVGLIVGEDERGPILIEALNKVRRHPLLRYVGNGNQVAVARPLNVGDVQMRLILDYMERSVGQTYGYGKIVLHALKKLGIPLLDRVERFQVDEWPICSYLVAKAFERAGLSFGVPAGLATPDDMYDFAFSHPDKYEVLFGLHRITY